MTILCESFLCGWRSKDFPGRINDFWGDCLKIKLLFLDIGEWRKRKICKQHVNKEGKVRERFLITVSFSNGKALKTIKEFMELQLWPGLQSGSFSLQRAQEKLYHQVTCLIFTAFLEADEWTGRETQQYLSLLSSPPLPNLPFHLGETKGETRQVKQLENSHYIIQFPWLMGMSTE